MTKCAAQFGRLVSPLFAMRRIVRCQSVRDLMKQCLPEVPVNEAEVDTNDYVLGVTQAQTAPKRGTVCITIATIV